MIDLHTHTLLSDGELLPSELVRRAVVKNYEAIALTDHVDSSNIDFVLPRIVKVSGLLSQYWPIKVIPGLEITHAPLQEIGELIKYGRDNGAKIVVVHGETVSEPVLPGTNKEAIRCKADILAHPGLMSEEDARLAKKNKVYIEVSKRKSHARANQHIREISNKTGVELILSTDTHGPDDLVNDAEALGFLRSQTFSKDEISRIFQNLIRIVSRL